MTYSQAVDYITSLERMSLFSEICLLSYDMHYLCIGITFKQLIEKITV